MQNQNLIITLFLVTIVILASLVVYLFVQLSKLKQHEKTPKKAKAKESSVPVGQMEANCSKHPEKEAVGLCNICEESFCKDCIKEHDGLSFCSEHLKLFLSQKWENLQTIKTTPDDPYEALHLYDLKRELWQTDQTPLVVRTHYKINLEGDYIESYVELLCSETNVASVSQHLENQKDEHA